MKLLLRVAILLNVLLPAACMQSTAVHKGSEIPLWVHSEPGLYPNIKYLSATGSASKAEQAKARALSNLAKIFEVKIREVTTTQQNIHARKEEGVETVVHNQLMHSTVNLETDKMVKGARIAEQWYSNADFTYFALAVLDRTQAGNNIRREMNRLDEATQFSLDQSKKRNDMLLKIADLHNANELQQQRMALQQTLKIIDINGRGMPAYWSMAELSEQLQLALRSLPLQTEVKADDSGALSGILQGAAAAAGFNVGNTGYLIVASLVTQQPIEKDSWFWLRGTLKLELIAADGDTVLGYQSWPLKVSAGEPSQLPVRMLKAADQILKQELLNSILEFVT